MSRVRPEQLAAQLERNLAPVYFLHGDEPLQLGECADAVRQAARAAGFGERRLFQVERGFDWDSLAAEGDSLSLFAEKRLLELRMPTGKPGEAGARALRAWCAQPPPDTLLLILSGRLEASARRAKWVQALESAGVSVAVWPVEPARLPDWIRRRMRARGLEPDAEAVQWLAERTEGNLLACAQAIDKLLLARGPGPVDGRAVLDQVAGAGRYDVFDLVDAALGADAARGRRVLDGLLAEGTDPTLILWALARELRALAAMAAELEAGQGMDAVLARHRVWEQRKRRVAGALRRLPARRLRWLLAACAHIDRVIKGRAPGTARDELLQLTLRVAGVPLLRASA